MAIVLTFDDQLIEIVKEIEKLSDRQKHLLLLKLKRQQLFQIARKLDKSVKKNKLTDDDIAQQVAKNRKQWKKT